MAFNLGNILKDLPTKIFGAETVTFNKGGGTTVRQTEPNIIQRFSSLATRLLPRGSQPKRQPLIQNTFAQSQKVDRPSPLPSPTVEVSKVQPQLNPQPAVGETFDTAEIERKIRAGFRTYSRGQVLPVEKHIPAMVKATQRYDVFRKNPFLLPQIAILETSGGRNITRPNNILNWGINFPGNNEIFAKMTEEEVLERAISGLGERSQFYNEFRDTGDIQMFADIYEPANASYGPNLIKGIKFFETQ